MVIPASMNQIHGGAQLIRLVLTSISALMIKTLQKALTQPDVFPCSGSPHSGHPAPGQSQLWDTGAPKKVGWAPCTFQQQDPAQPWKWHSLQALLPRSSLASPRSAHRIPGWGRQERVEQERRTPVCATVGLGVLGTQAACLAMNN